MTDYKKIREENIKEYGIGTKHLGFLERLYSDRTHFIFELLQNAEDAGATKVFIGLRDNELEVLHDARRRFDKEDVRGICGVDEGSKDKELTQIGKFGIGFKSVYAYTTRPKIYSGDEHFAIENYVRPHTIEKSEIPNDYTTKFVFPFDKEDVPANNAYDEISEKLQNLDSTTLLFLKNISEIEYRLPGEESGFYIRETKKRKHGKEVTILAEDGYEDSKYKWLVFEPKDLEGQKTTVEIAYSLEEQDEGKVTIDKIHESPLVVFFPTEKETRLGFLIQGPFNTTPARDNIPRDDERNEDLIKEIAELVINSLQWLKEMKMLDVSLLEALPIRDEHFPYGGMFTPIAEKVREVFLSRPLLPTYDGDFVSATQAKIARGADLCELLPPENLALLYNSKKTLKWITTEISVDKSPDLHNYLLNNLKIEEVVGRNFARKLNKAFLQQQSDGWLMEFYKYASAKKELWKKSGFSKGHLLTQPIVRLENNDHVKPFDENNEPQAFIPPQFGTSDLPLVKKTLIEDEGAREFLENCLELTEPKIVDYVIKKVLPRYSSPEITSISSKQHEKNIELILNAVQNSGGDELDRLKRDCSDVAFVKAEDKEGNNLFEKPGHVYLDNDELRLYFNKTTDTKFISENQYNENNESLWYELGVMRLPALQYSSEKPEHVSSKYSTNAATVKDYTIHGFDDIFHDFIDVKDIESLKKTSLVLAEIIDKYISKDRKILKGVYKWFYYKDRSKEFETSLVKKLKSQRWLFDKNHELKSPRELTKQDILPDYLEFQNLLNVLEIQEVDENKEIESKIMEYLNEKGIEKEDVDFLFKHPHEFKSFKEKYLKQPKFPSSPPHNPERRSKKVKEEYSGSTNKAYEPRQRNIRTSTSDTSSKTYLQSQYTNEEGELICQICKLEMPFKKPDGNYYFDEREMFDRKLITKEHHSTRLALCPICSAKYHVYVREKDEAMQTFKEKILQSEEQEPEIEIQLDEPATVKFVGQHFQDLKDILEEEKNEIKK